MVGKEISNNEKNLGPKRHRELTPKHKAQATHRKSTPHDTSNNTKSKHNTSKLKNLPKPNRHVFHNSASPLASDLNRLH